MSEKEKQFKDIEGNKKIRVILKKGEWNIEVEFPENTEPDKVQTTLENISKSIIANRNEDDLKEIIKKIIKEEINSSNIQPNNIKANSSERKSHKTCRNLIEELWTEKWLDQERSLGEVHEELARKGYHYDRTAVSHTLTDLVRENILTRVGTIRNYRYIQKRPPQSI